MEKSRRETLFLPVAIFSLNVFVYKRLHAKNRQFSMKIRLVFGMVFATLSMCITGVVEITRQNRCDVSFHTTQIIGM